MRKFVKGQRWIFDPDLKLGLGTVIAIETRTVLIEFGAAGQQRVFARDSAPLTRITFSAGDGISTRDGRSVNVESVDVVDDLYRYTGRDASGTVVIVIESDLADILSLNRPVDRLFNGQVDPDKWYRLRHRALVENSINLASDLYGLVGTRTSLIEHQLYIASEVSGRYSPRVLLADEVGLGKTIEAGLILHRQLLTEKIRRVLVIVPESLVHQWLLEMLRRFNLMFSIFDEERCETVETGTDGGNPFISEQLVLCQLEFLNSHPHRVEQLADAGWDMLVVDEAHHLHWTPQDSTPEYLLIEKLAAGISAVMFLTATPEQTGRAGHFARLRLLDPDRYPDIERYLSEEAAYRETAAMVEHLIGGDVTVPAEMAVPTSLSRDSSVKRLLAEYSDPQLQGRDRDAVRERLIQALLDRHGTGRVLFRNTRAAVSGFPVRVLNACPLPCPGEYTMGSVETDAGEPLVTGEILSPEIRYTRIRTGALPGWTRIDPRIEWLIDTLRRLRPDKVLVITATFQSAIDIGEALRMRAGIHAPVFHERMTLMERDRAAAFFADGDAGSQLMVCSEIGSEGRNFQFARHLVLFDLPLNPDLLEQRIGRLDRIGQSDTIYIHVPYLQDTAQSVMFRWYHEGLDALTRTCPAAYHVYLQLRDPLTGILQLPGDQGQVDKLVRLARDLASDINRELGEGRDRLLEFNSCRPERAAALKQAAMQFDNGARVAGFMEEVFDCFGIHSEDHSPECLVLTPGEKMVMPYPGLPDEGMTITWSREVALANEHIQYFSWEHPMVITAVDLVLSSELGNSTLTSIKHPAIGSGMLLAECLYVLEAGHVAGMQVEEFCPPVLIRTFVDLDGRDLSPEIPHETVNELVEPVNEEIARQVIKIKETEIRRLLELTEPLARVRMPALVKASGNAADTYFNRELERLRELAAVNPNVRQEEIEFLESRHLQVTAAIRTAVMRLDAIRVIVGT